MIAVEAERSRIREKFRELQTKRWAVDTVLPAGLVDQEQIAKLITTLEMQLKGSHREMQKVQCQLQVTRGAVEKARHLAFRKSEEARPGLHQLEGERTQQNLTCEKVTNVEAPSVKAAV